MSPFPMGPAVDKSRKCRVYLYGQRPIHTTEQQIGIGVMWLCLKRRDGGYINHPWHKVEKVEFDPPCEYVDKSGDKS